MKHWISTWGMAHTDIRSFSPDYRDRTMRLCVSNNLSGEAVRLRFSNQNGKAPLHILHGAIQLERSYPILFTNKANITLNPGEEAYSDAVAADIRQGMKFLVSIAFRGAVSSGNNISACVQCSSKGDYVDAVQFQSARRGLIASYFDMMPPIPALSGIEVLTDRAASALVCFGDSITQQGHWFNPLAERLYQRYPDRVSLINKGIGGNRLLHNGMPLVGRMHGQAGKDRFCHDILAEEGIGAVLFAIGTNDIGFVRDPKSETWVSAEMLIPEYEKLIHLARQRNISVFGSTILPRAGSFGYSALQEQERRKVNEWFQETNLFDLVFDFDAELRDPINPQQMSFEYDSGDHLHPNSTGGKRLADSIADALAMHGEHLS